MSPSRALLAALLLLVACPGTRRTQPHDGRQREGGQGFNDLSQPPADLALADIPRRDRGPTKPDQRKPDQAPPPCPGGCDDGDPCTADACAGGACDHTKLGQTVRRYYSTATGAHAYGVTGGPGGFIDEGPVFRTLAAAAAGSVAIYQQSNGTDYMISQSDTEGATVGYFNAGNIGHGLGGAVGSAVPLYRLYNGAAGLHLSSTSSTEGTQVGYALEGVTVHVCPL